MADEEKISPVITDPAGTTDELATLKQENEDLFGLKEIHELQLQDLENQLRESIAERDALKGERDGLKSELDQAETLLQGQNVTIGELTAEIEKLHANPSTVPTFTLNKKTYEVHSSKFKFRTGTAQIPKEYTVEELLKDKALQAELVKKGVGFIVEKV